MFIHIVKRLPFIALVFIMANCPNFVLAQSCGSGSVTTLARWDMSGATTCNSAVENTYIDYSNNAYQFAHNRYLYCPNVNNGCGRGLLGSIGHANTSYFSNAICLLSFYDNALGVSSYGSCAGDFTSTSWDPNSCANFYINWTIPQGNIATLSEFNLQVLQKQFDGSSLNFTRQGVQVKRNGVVIYTNTQNITAGNINGSPIAFSFPSSNDFCADGRSDVRFEIIFGLAGKLKTAQTGYDNITLMGKGTCTAAPPPPPPPPPPSVCSFNATMIPNTCTASVPNSDAKLILSGYPTGAKYDYSSGLSYSGSASYATAAAIPSGGVILNNIANPASIQYYTIKVFTADGCTETRTVSLSPVICPCIITGVAYTLSPSCAASGANTDGKIVIAAASATSKYAYSTGVTYSGGATYATATTIPVNGIIASTLANPASPQAYTVVIWESAGCSISQTINLNPSACPVCTTPSAVVTATAATCTSGVLNNNAQIAITSATNATKSGIYIGNNYDGVTYANATALAGSYTYTALANPAGNTKYTVRIFGTYEACYKDYAVTLTEATCSTCKKMPVEVIRTGALDPDSSPNNGRTAEDDLATYETCKANNTIDLALTKTVSPSSGITCPAGTTFTWTLTLQNTGTMTATDIQVADLLPNELTLISSSASIGSFGLASGWRISSLAASASATLTLTTKALRAGTFTNCAEVVTAFPLNDPDSTPGNYSNNEDDDECVSITVTGNSPPSISKEFSPMLTKPNTPTRLTIKINNNESAPINLTATLIDNLPSSPAQMRIASTPNLTTNLVGVVATANGTSITIPSGAVLTPGLNQISVDVIMPSDGMYCNDIAAGELQTTACDNVLAARACTDVVTNYDLAPIISKSFSPQIVQTGQNSILTLKVENRNAGTMTLNQDFIDYLPASLIVAGAATTTCGGTVTATLGDTKITLPGGSTIAPGTCTITVPVKSNTVTTTWLCNTIYMNSLITTLGTNNNLGNEDVAQACLKVIGTPCTVLSSAAITPATATATTGTTINFAASATGTGAQTTYNWESPSNGSFNNQAATTTYTVPSTAGVYEITVTINNYLTGAGLCKATTMATITVTPPCTLTVNASQTNVNCNAAADGTATAAASGNNYTVTYLWSDGQTTATANGLSATTYTVTVTDFPTCTATASVTLTQPAVLSLTTTNSSPTCYGDTDASITILPTGGTAPYTYSLDDGGTFLNNGGTFTGLGAGSYKPAIKDSKGCIKKCN